jgi:hypothetical protein
MINEDDNKDDDYKDDDFDENATFIDEEEIIPDELDTSDTSDTSVIAITCHGHLNPSNYNYIVIPEGFEVVKINTSYLGCIRYDDKYSANKTVETIYKKYKHLLSQYDNIFEKAIDDIIRVIEQFNELEETLIRKKKLISYDYHDTEYLRRNRESIYVEYLKPGDRIIDKSYNRNSDEKIDYFRAIPVISDKMNIDSYQDLLSEIGGKIFDREVIHLKNIIDYFISIGKTKLVIFDLSCSTFLGVDKDFDPRSTRAARRNIIREIRDEKIDIYKKTKRPRLKGGKNKNKSRKNKNKSRKNKNKSRKNKNKSRKNKNKSNHI